METHVLWSHDVPALWEAPCPRQKFREIMETKYKLGRCILRDDLIAIKDAGDDYRKVVAIASIPTGTIIARATPAFYCFDEAPDRTTEQQLAEAIAADADLSEYFPRQTRKGCSKRHLTLFERSEVVKYNAFYIQQTPELFSNVLYNGLETIALYPPEICSFNHSCAPNVAREHVLAVAFFRATRSIEKGEELCISYVDSETLRESPSRRAKILSKQWGFKCSCPVCQAVLPAVSPARKKIFTKANLLRISLAKTPARRLKVLRNLRNTYSRDPLVSKRELVELLNSLVMESSNCRLWTECLRSLRVLAAVQAGSSSDTAKGFPLDGDLDENWVATGVLYCAAAALARKPNVKKVWEQVLRRHNALYGGCVERFKERYRLEFQHLPWVQLGCLKLLNDQRQLAT